MTHSDSSSSGDESSVLCLWEPSSTSSSLFETGRLSNRRRASGGLEPSEYLLSPSSSSLPSVVDPTGRYNFSFDYLLDSQGNLVVLPGGEAQKILAKSKYNLERRALVRVISHHESLYKRAMTERYPECRPIDAAEVGLWSAFRPGYNHEQAVKFSVDLTQIVDRHDRVVGEESSSSGAEGQTSKSTQWTDGFDAAQFSLAMRTGDKSITPLVAYKLQGTTRQRRVFYAPVNDYEKRRFAFSSIMKNTALDPNYAPTIVPASFHILATTFFNGGAIDEDLDDRLEQLDVKAANYFGRFPLQENASNAATDNTSSDNSDVPTPEQCNHIIKLDKKTAWMHCVEVAQLNSQLESNGSENVVLPFKDSKFKKLGMFLQDVVRSNEYVRIIQDKTRFAEVTFRRSGQEDVSVRVDSTAAPIGLGIIFKDTEDFGLPDTTKPSDSPAESSQPSKSKRSRNSRNKSKLAKKQVTSKLDDNAEKKQIEIGDEVKETTADHDATTEDASLLAVEVTMQSAVPKQITIAPKSELSVPKTNDKSIDTKVEQFASVANNSSLEINQSSETTTKPVLVTEQSSTSETQTLVPPVTKLTETKVIDYSKLDIVKDSHTPVPKVVVAGPSSEPQFEHDFNDGESQNAWQTVKSKPTGRSKPRDFIQHGGKKNVIHPIHRQPPSHGQGSTQGPKNSNVNKTNMPVTTPVRPANSNIASGTSKQTLVQSGPAGVKLQVSDTDFPSLEPTGSKPSITAKPTKFGLPNITDKPKGKVIVVKPSELVITKPIEVASLPAVEDKLKSNTIMPQESNKISTSVQHEQESMDAGTSIPTPSSEHTHIQVVSSKKNRKKNRKAKKLLTAEAASSEAIPAVDSEAGIQPDATTHVEASTSKSPVQASIEVNSPEIETPRIETALTSETLPDIAPSTIIPVEADLNELIIEGSSEAPEASKAPSVSLTPDETISPKRAIPSFIASSSDLQIHTPEIETLTKPADDVVTSEEQTVVVVDDIPEVIPVHDVENFQHLQVLQPGTSILPAIQAALGFSGQKPDLIATTTEVEVNDELSWADLETPSTLERGSRRLSVPRGNHLPDGTFDLFAPSLTARIRRHSMLPGVLPESPADFDTSAIDLGNMVSPVSGAQDNDTISDDLQSTSVVVNNVSDEDSIRDLEDAAEQHNDQSAQPADLMPNQSEVPVSNGPDNDYGNSGHVSDRSNDSHDEGLNSSTSENQQMVTHVSQPTYPCAYCSDAITPTELQPCVLCPGCGFDSSIRYCSIACLLVDAFDHSMICLQLPAAQHPPVQLQNYIYETNPIMPLSPTPRETKAKFRQRTFTMFCKQGEFPDLLGAWMKRHPNSRGVEAYEENQFYHRTGDYHIFSSRVSGGVRVVDKADVIFTLLLRDGIEMKKVFNRCLRACFLLSKAEAGIILEFVFRMIRSFLEPEFFGWFPRTTWREACVAEFHHQFREEFDFTAEEQVNPSDSFDYQSEAPVAIHQLVLAEERLPILQHWNRS